MEEVRDAERDHAANDRLGGPAFSGQLN